MNNEAFQLEFDLTRDDLSAYEGYWLANSKVVGRSIYPLAVVFGAITGLVVIALIRGVVWLCDAAWDSQANYFFPVAAAVSAVMAVYIVRSQRGTLLRRLEQQLALDLREPGKGFSDDSHLGLRTVTISADGVEFSSARGTNTRVWSAINHVGATDTHLFVISDNAFLIPARAFDSDESFRQCREFVISRATNHRDFGATS